MSARRNFKFAVEELKNYSVKIFSKNIQLKSWDFFRRAGAGGA